MPANAVLSGMTATYTAGVPTKPSRRPWAVKRTPGGIERTDARVPLAPASAGQD